MNIFERATRGKLRFASAAGLLSTEQLFDLPLSVRGNGVSLDAVGRAVVKELKELDDGSLVDENPNPRKATLELALDIVKHIIAVKQEDRKRAEEAVATKERRKALEDALADKASDALKNMSEDDIRKELAELDKKAA